MRASARSVIEAWRSKTEMPAVASIQIIVDEKGAVTALNNLKGQIQDIEPGFRKVGQTSNVVLTQMTKDHDRAREAARLLREETGIFLPRAIQNLAAQSESLGAILNAAFSGLAVYGFVDVVARSVGSILDTLQNAREVERKAREATENAIFSQGEDIAKRSLANIHSLRVKDEEALGSDLTKLRKKYEDEYLRIKSDYAEAERLGDVRVQKILLEELAALNRDYSIQKQVLAQKEAASILQSQNKINEAGLVGLQLIEQQTIDTEAVIEQQFRNGAISYEEYQKQRAVTDVEAGQKRKKFYQDLEDSAAAYRIQSERAGATGVHAIELQLEADLAEIQKREIELGTLLPGRRSEAEAKAAREIEELHRKAALETQQMESQAALASLPPWQQAYARIRTEAEQRVRDTQEQLRKTEITEEDAAARTAAVWQQAYAQMHEQLARDIGSLFDDITSGNIGKRFLNEFKRMVAEMVATWVLGMKGLQASTSATLFGGSAGGALGSIFNIGGGAVPAGGALSGTSGIGSPIFSGFTGPEASMLGLPLSAGVGVGGFSANTLPAGASGYAAGQAPYNLLGGSGGFTSADAAMIGLPLSAGVGAGSVAGNSLPAGSSSVASGFSGFGGLLKGLGSLLPIGALAGGAALMGKGGIVGALGSGALGFGAGALAGSLLPTLAFSAVAAGILPMGALTATLAIAPFLGPIGAGIGLVAGLLSIFSGKGKLKIQQTQVLQDMEHQLDQIQNAYDVHQLDYNSAISQAEQIRQSFTQQQEQLQKGGSAGRVDPWVDALENHINSIEAQRYQRGLFGSTAGPAIFREGGFVGGGLARSIPGFAPAMHFASGGAVPAILHAGEFVMRPEAVQRVGVQKMSDVNTGRAGFGEPPQPVINLTIQAMDAKSFEQFLNSGGMRGFVRAWKLAKALGGAP
jgi:hypothetical protein